MIPKIPFQYFFEVDDVILALEDVSKSNYTSIFENKFFSIMKDAHDKHGFCVNLALFYKTSPRYMIADDNFTLADMSDRFKQEFIDNSHWMKMSAHAWNHETSYNNEQRSYRDDYFTIKEQAIRFAGIETWFGKHSIIHFYNGRAPDLRRLASEIDKLYLISIARQLMPRWTSYVGESGAVEIHEKGLVKDRARNIWHLARDGTIEQILGYFTNNQTVYPTMSDFLNNEKRTRIKTFASHEYYFVEEDFYREGTVFNQYNQDVVDGVSDMAQWMKNNGYEAGFPNQDLYNWNWL